MMIIFVEVGFLRYNFSYFLGEEIFFCGLNI